MFRNKSIAIIILFAFIFNFAFFGVAPSRADDGGEESDFTTPEVENIYPNFIKEDDPERKFYIVGKNFKVEDIQKIRIGDIAEITKEDGITVSDGGTEIGFSLEWDAIKPNSSGAYTVVVEFTNKEYSLIDIFYVAANEAPLKPTVETFIPNTGSITGGTEVTIEGGPYLQGEANGKIAPPEVKFGDVIATQVKVLSTKKMVVIAPPHSPGLKTIKVKNPDADEIEAEAKFEYVAPGELISILSITPDRGTGAGGTPVEIRGINFPTALKENAGKYSDLQIYIGEVPVTDIIAIEVDKSTPADEEGREVYIIKAETPTSSIFGTQDVKVQITWSGIKNDRTEVAVLEKGFNYYKPATEPKIKEVRNIITNTNDGPVNGGHGIQIVGNDFVAPVKIYFGRAEVKGDIKFTRNENNDQVLAFVLPALDPQDAIGPVDVKIENEVRSSDDLPSGEFTFPAGFTYRKTGVRLAAITPDAAFQNEGEMLVEITGMHLTEDIVSNTNFSFGEWLMEEDEEITDVDASYTDNYVITYKDEASFEHRSEKFAIDPSSVDGEGKFKDQTKILARIPKTLNAGMMDLILENSYGIVILRNAFEVYRYDLEPEIKWVTTSPPTVTGNVYESPKGPTAGGTEFTILGENFQSKSEVYVGGFETKHKATVKSITNNKIVAVSPKGLPSWQHVYIKSPFGKIGSTESLAPDDPAADWPDGTRGFYYFSEPKIKNVTPQIGNVNGGTIITITGEQFYPGAQVEFLFPTGLPNDGKKYLSVTKAVYEQEVLDTSKIMLRLPSLLLDKKDILGLQRNKDNSFTDQEITDIIKKINADLDDKGVKVRIAVTNTDGETATWEPFTYKQTATEAPEIDSVSPVISKTAGGMQVIIEGKNFKNPIVYFGWDEAKILSSTETYIVVLTPRKAQAGRYPLTVTNQDDGATVVWDQDFLFLEGAQLHEITSIVPNKGPLVGGTKVTITTTEGEFHPDAQVWIGGKQVPAQNVKANYTHLTALTPKADQVGSVDVMVVNPDGETYYRAKGFTYENPEANPGITKVSPSQIPITGKTVVVIEGEGFQQKIKVYIGSEEAEILLFEEPTKIFVKAPAYPLGVPAKVPVTVLNPDGGVAQKEIEYVKTQSSPEIDSITPNRGPASGGNTVIIEGTGFRNAIEVYFGGRKAEVKSQAYNRLEVIVPFGEANQAVDVTVTNTEPEAIGSASIAKGYTYQPYRFAINSVAPSQGTYLGGTLVTIKGQGFASVVKAVYIDEWQGLNVEVLDPETITFTTPAVDLSKLSELKLWDVKVVNGDGQEAIKKNAFRYLVPETNPIITSIDPIEGPNTGGLPILIKGSDFRERAKVVIGGQDALVIRVVDEKTIIAQIPPYTLQQGEAEKLVKVLVVNYDGATSNEKNFTYKSPRSFPEIDTITPSQGPAAGGTEIIITGIGFKENKTGSGNALPPRVWIGLNEAPMVQFVDYTTLRVITPPGVAGNADVLVLNHDMGQAIKTNGFRYVPSKPAIISITPNEGGYHGGTQVTIVGRDLSLDAKIYIGPWEAKRDPDAPPSSENIVIITPAAGGGATGNADYVGWYDVKVVNSDGVEVVLANGYRYLYPETSPEITAIEPTVGSTLGGLPITITGVDFRDRARVIVGGKEAEVLYIKDDPDASKIIARIPPHTPGKKDVVVVNYDGATSKPHPFTYEAPLSFPEIHEITPKEGLTLGGTAVTIKGIGFKETYQSGSALRRIRVWFGMNEAPEVKFLDYKTLLVVTPSGVEGPADVLVLNPDMGQTISPGGFRYLAPRGTSITSIDPNRGHAKGGTIITINGGPFLEGATVTLGGKEASEVIVADVGKILAKVPSWDIGYNEEAVVDVLVTNPDGAQALAPDGFTYYKTAPEHPPENVKTERKDRDTIEVGWDEVDFANYYEIWVSNTRNGKYVFLDQTDRNVYYATKLDPNKTYYFQIRAVNELGVSSFSYYEYARTGSGRVESADLVPERVVMEAANGQAVATIANADALSSSGYHIDFTAAQYKNMARKSVRISQGALTRAYLPITIDAPNLSLSVPAGSLSPALVGKGDVYAEVILLDLGQQEAERAIRELPRGSRIISPVYAVEWQVLQGTKETPQNMFHQQVNLQMNFTTAPGSGKQISLYTYNPASGKWINTGGANDRDAPRIALGINGSGRFMLVEH